MFSEKKKNGIKAESLFGSRESDDGGGAGRHDTGNVGILLHHIETTPGVVIVITNLKDRIDNAFFRRFKFVLEFPKPNGNERHEMWKLMIPSEAPLSKDVDLSVLANRFDFCGGNIKSAVFRAASRAALRASSEDRIIRMEDLVRSCEEETSKTSNPHSATTMSMYT
jgi:SpoVK/Ycf46/Vps4 family AAA+-type ATPase